MSSQFAFDGYDPQEVAAQIRSDGARKGPSLWDQYKATRKCRVGAVTNSRSQTLLRVWVVSYVNRVVTSVSNW